MTANQTAKRKKLMSFYDSYLQELDHEAISTRKTLERIPADKFDWAPHATSVKLGALANHIVSLPGRVQQIFDHNDFDSLSPEAIAMRPPAAGTTKELIDRWDKNLADMRAALTTAPEEKLAGKYTLKSGTETIFSMPRKIVLRAFILNHLIHHRGQLSVYLRMLEIPVPSIYGPSADEKVAL
jgi:uncharacterized damage-inducible protein DinB